ncbi:porin [Pseudoxanthomonas sp. 10H]|uniref:porin n=1 Tax=Pseudoxanthomonas sp. 10H TaxID=3242729 RepID=UPI003556C5DB
MKNKHFPAVALLALAVAPLAHAEVTFNGFGQVVGGATLDDGSTVSGLSYDDSISFDPESLFALQATATLGDRADAVAQVVARGDEGYDPEFAWAYIRYQLSPAWSVKAGRQRTPYFHYSDYLEVGSAYPFLRVPLGVYNLPYSNYNGVNLIGSRNLDKWSLRSQLFYGTVDEENDTLHVEVRDQAGATFEAQYDEWLSLRASYVVGEASVQVDAAEPLIAAVLAANPQAGAALAFDRDDASFLGLSAEINRGGFTVGVEYTEVDYGDNYIGGQESVAVNAAYRAGNWTPYASWSRSRNEPDRTALRMLPPAHPAYAMVAGLLASQDGDKDYASVGVRYDVNANIALKADYTRYDSTILAGAEADLVAAGVVFTY